MGRIVKADVLAATASSKAAEPGPSSDEVAAQVTEILVAARSAAEAERSAAMDAALVLARKMAEKIVGRAVELDASVMSDIASQALVSCRPRSGPIVLRVHPDDRAAVEAGRSRWPQDISALGVQLATDPTVGRSGCVVDTPVGRVDGRLATQLDALERALRTASKRS
jgi:flagellar biosynthesis/type III secretory pathway protein FliH